MPFATLLAMTLAAIGSPQTTPAPVATLVPPPAPVPPPPEPFRSLTAEFAAFADATVDLPDDERLRRFHVRFEPLFPGFYAARGGRDPAKYDQAILRALKTFPQIREKYAAAADRFAEAYATANVRFRTFFPDYTPTMPVYLVHSIGEMDGGTRDIRGTTVGVFGADVIARIHDESTIAPFLDHELFHFYHARYFPECEPIWCSLWTEGLAVYVAARMNPGVSDRGLLLTIPRPIRPEVEPKLAEALCDLRPKLESTKSDDYASLFYVSSPSSKWAPRYGYYVGYMLAAKLGETIPLDRLARLSPAEVKPMLLGAIDSYGCPRAASALQAPPPAAAR